MSTDVSNPPISRSAARLRLAVFVAMAFMLLVYVVARFGLRLQQIHVEYAHDADAGYARPISDVSMALLLVALFKLTQMLRLISAGQLFSTGVIRHFRGFARWLLIMALFELVAPIIAGLFAASQSHPHQVQLALDIRDLLTVGTTLFLFLLASLLDRARRLDDEMREFV